MLSLVLIALILNLFTDISLESQLSHFSFSVIYVTAGEHGHHLWRLGIDPTQHYPVLTGNFSSDC